MPDENADWTRNLREIQLFATTELRNWDLIVFMAKGCQQTGSDFSGALRNVGQGMGFKIQSPRVLV
jgi:hypothetical protein